jgi:hypothetical protein
VAAARKPAAKKGAAPVELPTQGPLAQIFGVRHLSPMGAWHLKQLLDKVDPTAILIEGPSDGSELVQHFINKKTKPPIAILAFTKQRPVRSILFPLAEYSPEWVAATWGARQKRHVRFMDLAAATFLGLQAEEDAARLAEREKGEGGPEEGAPGDPADAPVDPKAAAAADPAANGAGGVPEGGEAAARKDADTQAYLDDPYEEICRLSGDPDHDTWWERNFEHSTEETSYRESIFEFGAGLRSLREETGRRHRETMLREAFMRRVIRDTLAEGHDPARVVVVCGAFHAPVLTWEEHAMTDAEIRALPRLETRLALMPYSYRRLSSQSGYGAGNHAPNYFQALWEELSAEGTLRRLPVRYMAQIAGSLRKSGNIRSSAEVIEAVRLANAVACLPEDRSAPTLRDLRDAAVVLLGQGDQGVLERHLHEIEIGTSIGALPPGVAQTAIQEDFHLWIKLLKLDDYLKDKKQVVKGRADKGLALDLREDRFSKSKETAMRDRNVSIFLRRLELLEIGFAGDETSAEDRAQSTFKERWSACWTPECEINLAESSLRGDTIEIAAVRKLQDDLHDTEDVAAAAGLADKAVRCNLPDSVEGARARVQELAVSDSNFVSLARGLFSLAHTARFKDVSNIDVEPLKPLVGQLFLRSSMVAGAAARCDNDAAKAVGKGLADVEFITSFEDWGALLATDRWHATLNAIADDELANPHVAGVACALLLEQGLVPDDVLDGRITRHISPGMDPGAGAGYFEGLASRNHMALLSRKKLWATMDAFLDSLDDAQFKRALISLRRAFAAFEAGESRRIAGILGELWGGGENELLQAIETKIDTEEIARLNEDLGDLGDLDL